MLFFFDLLSYSALLINCLSLSLYYYYYIITQLTLLISLLLVLSYLSHIVYKNSFSYILSLHPFTDIHHLSSLFFLIPFLHTCFTVQKDPLSCACSTCDVRDARRQIFVLSKIFEFPNFLKRMRMTVHVQMATTTTRSAGGRGRASQVAASPSGSAAAGIEWKEHGISPPLVVQEREGWGRGVFTTKPLKCGVDVFPPLDPLVCVLMSDGVRGRFCDYCFIPAEKSDKSEFLNKKCHIIIEIRLDHCVGAQGVTLLVTAAKVVRWEL